MINSVDNTPAQVEVSYSVLVAGNTENIVKTEILTTPFVIGGEEVKVAYDSLSYRWQGKYNSSTNIFKRNYTPKGADYLSIKNLSNVDLEYCVVGNNPIQYYDSGDILRKNDIVNKNSFDASKVIKYVPGPIYNEIPLLYIIKPDLAPKTDCYFLKNTGTYAQKVNLTPPYFGGKVTSVLSLSDVLNLYKEDYPNRKIYNRDWGFWAEILAVAQKNKHPLFEKAYEVLQSKGLPPKVWEKKQAELEVFTQLKHTEKGIAHFSRITNW